LNEIKDGTEQPHIRWFRLGPSQELHIIEVDSLNKKIPKGVHIALAVGDFDSFCESIEKRNLNYYDWPGSASQISTRPDKVRQLYFQDPDGYWVEVNDGKQFNH
jgi:lactoylglutathione lyase